jgi:hypothetical protein
MNSLKPVSYYKAWKLRWILSPNCERKQVTGIRGVLNWPPGSFSFCCYIYIYIYIHPILRVGSEKLMARLSLLDLRLTLQHVTFSAAWWPDASYISFSFLLRAIRVTAPMFVLLQFKPHTPLKKLQRFGGTRELTGLWSYEKDTNVGCHRTKFRGE